MDSKVLIRDATAKDLSVILELIYLKAEFDGCPDAVEATSLRLNAHLFGESPLASVLLAEIEGNAVGFATYHRIYSTFLAQPGIWLDDLYLKPDYRNNRIGEALMIRLCQIAGQMGCGRIDWTVAASNPRAIRFYERMGARLDRKVRLCRLDRQAISRNCQLSQL